uniref:Exportin-2 n=1 Tax=Schistocephalus solidus TaxID=70667 RepID=A0A0X3PS99_SCHSO
MPPQVIVENNVVMSLHIHPKALRSRLSCHRDSEPLGLTSSCHDPLDPRRLFVVCRGSLLGEGYSCCWVHKGFLVLPLNHNHTMDPSYTNDLALKLEKTLSPVLEERRKAENFLKSVEKQPGYSVYLLFILQDSSRPMAVRLSAAITLKNFIKNHWKLEADADNLIPDADRNHLKAQLINAMLTSTGSIQHQLSEAIGLIGREDFPSRWPDLLPDIIQRMAQLGADMDTVQGLLYTAHSLFKRYRHEMRSNELFSEMKLVIQQFAEPLTTLATNLMNFVVGPNRINDGPRLVNIFRALLFICKIFLSLNCQDLPEFFEDNMAQWMQIFRELLRLDPQMTELVNTAAVTVGYADEDCGSGGSSLVEQVKSQVCDNIGLYATKYASDFTPYLAEFVKDVWEMLITTKVEPKYDMLIGNALEFLSSVVSRPQHKQLFESPETLQKLCELIILPNIQLSSSDEELFEDNPEEYIRHDLEGSDAHTRRKSACNLVCALCEAFEGPVISNFATYITHLLSQYEAAVAAGNASAISSWGAKDSALLLVTSLASRGKTEKLGVTSSSELVNIPTFFESHVLPELQNPAVDQLPVIKADCLRYAITFRGLLPSATIPVLVNLVPNFLAANSPVVHNYAAVLLEKLLLMTLPDQPILTPLVSKMDISAPDLLIQRLLETLSRQCSLESVYLMRALLRACACLEDRCLPSMNILVPHLVNRLGQVVKNPTKPQFNHFLFEVICLSVKLTCAADCGSIVHFEAALFPVFQEILQNDITEFFPYVFQLLAVMLEQYSLCESVLALHSGRLKNGSNVPNANVRPAPPYTALLPRLMTPSLWETGGTVAPLARLMQAYLLHNLEAVLSLNKVEAMLGIFQRLIASRTNDVHAFTVLTALLLSVPRQLIQPFLSQVFICIFQRLQSAKTEKFLRCLTHFLANFVLIFSANDLILITDSVQDRIFGRILEKVIIPYAETAISSPFGLINPTQVLTTHCNAGDAHATKTNILSSVSMSHLARNSWRTVSAGLVNLCTDTDQLSPVVGAKYHSFWAPLVNAVVSGLTAGPGKGGVMASEAAVVAESSTVSPTKFGDERFTDVTGDSTSYSLIFASYRLPDLCPEVTDPRSYLSTKLGALSARVPGKVC